MKKYRLQANISHWLADLARRAAHIECRSISSYVANLIVQDLRAKGLMDERGVPVKTPRVGGYRRPMGIRSPDDHKKPPN